MEKLQIQLFGGRGSRSGLGVGVINSGYLSSNTVKLKGGKINEKKFKSLNEWESAIRYINVEIFVACDMQGNPIYAYSSGDANKVDIPPSKYYDFESHIVTHNHPNNSTFSFEDIISMVEYNFSEIRAVVQDGTFVFKKTDLSNNGILFDIETNGYDYHLDFSLELERIRREYLNGNIAYEEIKDIEVEMHRKIYGEYYEKLAKKYGYKYFFIKNI